MKIRAVIFDYDEVIARTDLFHEYAVGRVLQSRGFPLNPGWYMSCFFGRKLADGFIKYLLEIQQSLDLVAELAAAKKAFDVEYEARVTPHEDALDLIARVRGKFPLAIASGTRKILCDAGLRKLGLTGVFNVVVTSEHYGKSKPDPDAFLTTLRTLNEVCNLTLQPEEVVVIEDSPLGVDAAKAARMICVAVTHTHRADQLARADLVVTDLRDVDGDTWNIATP